MAIKRALFNIKGMTRDLAASKFSPEFAYENKNLRLVATDDNTSYALTNERGNVESNISWDTMNEALPQVSEGNYVFGTPIGQQVLGNNLILFTAGENINIPEISFTESTLDISSEESTIDNIAPQYDDNIYKFWFNEGELKGRKLFSGDLNFNVHYPIESLGVYENTQLQKVYWVDGLNQTRVINVEATADKILSWTENSFNSVRSLALKEEISISRNIVANGILAPGVIQYAFTYYSLYGQETNIFYTSPQYYVSYNNRGASPEDSVSNSFSINIEGGTYDTHFDYIRVYSILRTSLNGVPQVRKVVDLAIPANGSTDILYTDTGIDGETLDPTDLFYIGGEEVVAGTLTTKDNVLFLGNLKVNRHTVSNALKLQLYNTSINFGSEHREGIDVGSPSGLYPYVNQLKTSSKELKTFKYLEQYRFGIQAQDSLGKWTAPVWINDAVNTAHPTVTNTGEVYLPYAYKEISSSIISMFIAEGYCRIRPVVVFPSLSDRLVVCQGVLCPTVYNSSDRAGNAPFSQASWFFRPNSYIDVVNEANSYAIPSGTTVANSWGAQVSNRAIFTSNEQTIDDAVINFSKGKWVEFRHNQPIPENNQENAEIQCISTTASPYITGAGTPTGEEWVADNKENFYVDQSIVTLNSPDIEFDKEVRSLDTSKLKLRIIGAINLTASAGDISIQSETPVNNYYKTGGSNPEYYKEFPVGFYKEPIGTSNISKFGWRSIVSGAFWMDDVSAPKQGTGTTKAGSTIGFVIYPWHRSISYNNATGVDSSGYVSAKVGKKKLSILRYSFNNTYLNFGDIWTAYDSDADRMGVSDIAIFDSDEVSFVRLKGQENSNLGDINYYGNIDKLITFPNSKSKTDGYPIITTYRGLIKDQTDSSETTNSLHFLMSWDYHSPDENWKYPTPGQSPYVFHRLQEITDQTHALDPVSMKYKSTPHAVIALNYSSTGKQMVLPTNKYLKNGTSLIANSATIEVINNQYPFWDKTHSWRGVTQNAISFYPEYGYLWLGELYNDNVSMPFGGETEEAFENNVWVPAGEPVSLFSSNGGPAESIQLVWTEGDTYYQRYDCLKTYPFTMEDQNSVVDILSFMCETRVNVDGRYDRNRGQTNNLTMSPTNFNLLNTAYSQKNNFFSYRGTNSNKLNLESFPNTITWSKTKTLGEEVDKWSNISLASTLDLDGVNGNISALKKFNDALIAFQEKGISQILYNENVQIASATGVPIEIANSGKVNGKRCISNNIGCSNKWSIASTKSGIYFIDDITKDIYRFNGEFDNLSEKLGFRSWMTQNFDGGYIWNPKDFNGAVTYYDKINKDILFITKDSCLAFNENINGFSSFYSYEHTPYFETLNNRGIVWQKVEEELYYKPWMHREGDYNIFFNKYQPCWTTIVVNPEPTKDKMFNNLEFSADSFDGDTLVNNHTFDKLRTWNEYQEGQITLTNTIGKPSSLKKKFRIWRANIPRWNVNKNGQVANNRDRMRNPWLYLKLSMENENTYKTVLHNLIVDYFD